MDEKRVIEEQLVQERRLGRHVEHDERSRNFPARKAATLVSVTHLRHCPSFDQGHLGSCTGNAMAGALMTDPDYLAGRELTETDAIKLYMRATVIDGYPGSYPPDDTGSSGLAVAKAAKEAGYISSYAHAFGLEEALAALVVGPVIIGINWYSSFDNPSSTGYVKITSGATVRGGHEICLHKINVRLKHVAAYNSWGPSWGQGGQFHFSWATLDRLLKEGGDVVQVAPVQGSGV